MIVSLILVGIFISMLGLTRAINSYQYCKRNELLASINMQCDAISDVCDRMSP